EGLACGFCPGGTFSIGTGGIRSGCATSGLTMYSAVLGTCTGAAFAAGGVSASGASACSGASALGGSAAGASAAAAPPLSSSTRIGLPSEILSPTLTMTSFTTPAEGEGISIVALSVSRAMSDCSAATVSPGLTSTSMTSTSLKSPRSGSSTSFVAPMVSSHGAPATMRGRRCCMPVNCLDGYGIGLLGIEAVLLDRVRNHRRLDCAVVGERLERSDRDPVAVQFEVMAQPLTGVRTAVAVGAEHAIGLALGHERTDLIGEHLHVVGSRDRRPFAILQALLDVRQTRRLGRVQHVPAIRVQAVAAQFVETRAAPDVGGDAPVCFQQIGRGDDFAEDRAAAHNLDVLLALGFGAFLEQVHAFEDVGLRVLVRHFLDTGMRVVLVHHGDVIEHVFLV